MRMPNWLKRMRQGSGNGSTADDAADAAENIGLGSRGGFGLTRWTAGRQQAVEKLQAGYDRLLVLCQNIEDHMQSQRQQGQQATESLSQA